MSSGQAFAIWITGLPASGKSSITKELVRSLEARGISVVALESDAMREILTPEPTYSRDEREHFYRSLVLIGEHLTRSNVPVIFDATANRAAYRQRARSLIPRFVEVYVDCPLEVCRTRDPKGIYKRAASGTAATVPGVQDIYEPPEAPEVTLNCQDQPAASAAIVLRYLSGQGYL